MLLEMARMSCEDGLVMTLHPGLRRDHHQPTFERFGTDTGHDIPIRIELTEALRPLLERYGTHPGFHLVVFTVDESVWTRASWRRSPGSTRRSTSASRGGSSTRRMRSGAFGPP